jgi:hypothetical protein
VENASVSSHAQTREKELKMAFLDIVAFGVTLFALAILFLSGGMVLNYMKADPIVFNQSFTANGTTFNFTDSIDHYFSMFDWFFLLFTICLAIGMFVLGYSLPSNPIFLIVAILALLVWLFIAPYLTNSFIMLTNIPVFGAVVAKMPFMAIAIYYLPVIGFIIGAVSAIFVYGKGGSI